MHPSIFEGVDRPKTVAMSREEVWMARRPSLRPALKGCLALVQQRGESPARCTSSDAVEIARALLAVNVRSLTVVDRQLCLHLLLALAKVQPFTTFLNLLFTFFFLECCIAAFSSSPHTGCSLRACIWEQMWRSPAQHVSRGAVPRAMEQLWWARL